MSSIAVTDGQFSTEAALWTDENAHNSSSFPPSPWLVAGPSTAVLVIQTSLIPVILLSNLLILFAIKKSKNLHKLSYYLMANVAVADGSVAISLAIRLLTQTSYDGRGCLASCAFLVLSNGASISGVLLLCVHNFRSAKYHKLLKNGFSDGAARGLIAGSWLLWTALACYGALTADVTPDVTSNVMPDLTPDVTSNVMPDLTPNVTHHASNDVSTSVSPNVTPDSSTGHQGGTFFCHPIGPYYARSYVGALLSVGLAECVAVIAVHAHTILILRQYQSYLHSRLRNALPHHPHPHHPHHLLVDMVKLMHVDRARRMGYVITLVICMMLCCCCSVLILNAVLVLCPTSCGLSIEGIAPFSSLILVNCINNVCIYALKSKEFRQSFRKLLRSRDNRVHPLHL
jgi:hypothetical protein